MDGFTASPYRRTQTRPSSSLTLQASDKDSATPSALPMKSSKARKTEDAALCRKRNPSLSCSPQSTQGKKKNKSSTRSSQLGTAKSLICPTKAAVTLTNSIDSATASTHLSINLPLPRSRPPFCYKSQSKATTSTSTRSKNTALPRSWRQNPSLTCFPQFSTGKIRDTDPHRVALLWAKVMAPSLPPYARPTLSSQSRRQIQPNKSSLPDESMATSEIQTGSSVRLSATTALSTTSSGGRQSVKNATVRDADFEDTQLAPRGITIERQQDIGLGASAGAYAYFASDTPPDLAQSREFYKSKVEHGLAGRVDRDIDDSIFLPVDDDFVQSVQRAYCSLGEAKLPESEYKAYACRDLFIGQYVLLAKDTTRLLCAVRSVEWSLKPEPKGVVYAWHTPPIVPPDHPPPKPFNFDIEPDCQFWLCDKILNAAYRQNINIVVHSKPLGAFCPYFSIEFKARTDDQRVVLNQVAAAGSASLYNRYRLRLCAHPRPTPPQMELVRHYGLTMEKENWTLWRFEPKILDEAWAGCTMRNLGVGTCATEQGVRRLLQWINEIHRWALCEYALGCEDDIKDILRKDPNIRVSEVGLGRATPTI